MLRRGLLGMMLPLLVFAQTAGADGMGTFGDVGSAATSGSSGSVGTPPAVQSTTQNPWSDPATDAATKAQDCTAKDYLKQRPDVAAAKMDPLDHYTQYGKKEGMCHPPNAPPTPT